MRTFLYSPRIDDLSDLHEQVVRIAWYFGHLKDCTFTILSDLALDAVTPAPYIDGEVAQRMAELVADGRLRVASTLSSEPGALAGVIAWRGVAAAMGALSDDLARQIEVGELPVHNVDREHRMEGSLYIDVGNALLESAPDVDRYRRRFATLAARCDTHNAFLFCTGPSVDQYANYDFSNGLSIICNSVIFDTELLAHVKPEVLAFADPIFHFGCSSYAQAFRRQLRAVCAEYDLTLVVPIKYVNIFAAIVPELEERLIALPYRKDMAPNLDLVEQFEVRTSDNILTFLMLPVAASLARHQFLLGCDGRKLEDNAYFWSHNEKTQITSEMQNIQAAHPSFFSLDYDEYYLRHCENVAEYATAIEAAGKSLTSLAPSYIEALSVRGFAYSSVRSPRTLVSINPDLKDEFGHFYHYDVRVAEHVDDDTDVVIWANEQVDVPHGTLVVLPTFRHNSFQIRSRLKADISEHFRRELGDRLQELSLLPSDKTLYMYTCDLTHVEVVLQMAQAAPELFRGVQVHMNLFFMHFDVDVGSRTVAGRGAYQEALLRAQELDCARIFLYVDAERLRRLADAEIGPGFFRWPMINVSATDSLAAAQACAMRGERSQRQSLRVFCPATGQVSKGYDFACEVVKALNQSPHAGDFIFVLRNLLRDTKAVNKALKKLQQELLSCANVVFLDGMLTDAEYAAEYAKADVIFIPYRRSDFYSRTSAAMIDALYFGKPIVCASDTWLEEQAVRFGLARSYTDGDVLGCADTMAAISNRVAETGVVAKQVVEQWKEAYSAGNLLEVFRETDGRYPRGLAAMLTAPIHNVEEF